MEKTLVFSAKYSNEISENISRHIDRSEMPQNADPSLSIFNRHLVGYPPGITSRTQALSSRLGAIPKELKEEQYSILDMVFTTNDNCFIPSSEILDIMNWAYETLCWAQSTFSRENVVCAVLHMDEGTPHIHASITLLRENSTPQGKHLSLWTKDQLPSKKELSRSYWEAMKKYGIAPIVEDSNMRKITNSDFYRAYYMKCAQGEIRERKDDYLSFSLAMHEQLLQRVCEQTERKLEVMEEITRAHQRVKLHIQLMEMSQALIFRAYNLICPMTPRWSKLSRYATARIETLTQRVRALERTLRQCAELSNHSLRDEFSAYIQSEPVTDLEAMRRREWAERERFLYGCMLMLIPKKESMALLQGRSVIHRGPLFDLTRMESADGTGALLSPGSENGSHRGPSVLIDGMVPHMWFRLREKTDPWSGTDPSTDSEEYILEDLMQNCQSEDLPVLTDLEA